MTGTNDSRREIPSLDGARAVAIVLVILSHLTTKRYSIPLLWRVDYGNLGVRVFFVISGFLITSLLLKERQRTGAIDIGQFYLRRSFRIMPAYWVFLAIIALLIPFGWVRASYAQLPPALLYFSNYKFIMGSLGHTWSLSVEEQFYLLWPGALLLFGLRRSLHICLALLLTAPAFRVLSDTGFWPTQSRYAFECVCDALATGCVLAMLREQLWQVPLYRRLVTWRYALMLPVAALLLIAATPNKVLAQSVALSLLNFGLAITLDRYMRYPETAFGRVLNFAPVAWTGRISYSLYLWQQPFIYNATSLPVKLVGPFVCAAASYYLIERPALALRQRLTSQVCAVKRAATPQLAPDSTGTPP